MERAIKARILLVKVPPELIGIFTSLIDGSGRRAIVRTKESREDLVYLIATPDTYEELIFTVEQIKKHMPQVEMLGETEPSELEIN